MDEDIELNAFVKRGLEDGVALGSSRLAAIEAAAAEVAAAGRPEGRAVRRWGGFWGGSALAAACLAGACLWMSAGVKVPEPSSPEAELARAIGLLAESDGAAEGLDGSLSAAELLLAWQDMPYENALAEGSSGD